MLCRIWDAACVLTFETAAPERIADIVGKAGAGGAVVHYAALGVEAAGAGTRIDTLVPEQKKRLNATASKKLYYFTEHETPDQVFHDHANPESSKFNFDLTLP
jgi:hypothetical protein